MIKKGRIIDKEGITIYYHIIGIVEGNNFTEGSQVQF